MSAVAFALEKQRLQLAAESHRAALAGHAEGLAPLFDAADQVGAGIRWARQHPEALAATVALLLAARPATRRFAWRWGRRAFMAWRVWRDSRRWLQDTPAQP